MSVGIKIENLTKTFMSDRGSISPLNNFTLNVDSGRLTAIIGKSGCGKTTLLKLISGLEKPSSGIISFFDENGNTLLSPNISYVFQEPRLLPWKTVEQNLELPIRNLPASQKREKIDQVLDLVCLGDVKTLYPSELSGGMAQRVGLARGVISKPDLLLLDEPFSALDFVTRTRLQFDFMKMQNELDITMLMITHDINEAAFLSSKVVFLNKGIAEQELEIDVPQPRKLGDQRLLPYQNELLEIILE